MPQLDSFSFFSQVFWLVVIFFFFFMFVSKSVLPLFSNVLKFRLRRLSLGSDAHESFNKEANFMNASYSNIITDTFQNSFDLINSSVVDSKKGVSEISSNVFNSLKVEKEIYFRKIISIIGKFKIYSK